MRLGTLRRVLKKYLGPLGFFTGLSTLFKFKFVTNGLIRVKLKFCKHPFLLRASTSDLDVFEQIFLREEYDFPVEIKPAFIIDGVANIGLSSIFFANKFPEAIVIAIEPEDSNFSILQKNVLFYYNIRPLKTAIWNKSCNLLVKDFGYGKWGFITEEGKAENSNLQGVTIGEIIDNNQIEIVDILKLDVEGAEKEIFKSNYSNWLGKIRILIIELHERIIPGCDEVFYNAISRYNFSKFELGENLIFINKDI
jgi:FkbM family methyltransferase